MCYEYCNKNEDEDTFFVIKVIRKLPAYGELLYRHKPLKLSKYLTEEELNKFINHGRSR